jgi:hypothetical protein
MPPKKINELSGMPQMSAAFGGWEKEISLIRITQTLTDGLITSATETLIVLATWQPLSPEAIALKPDGQRSWDWYDLHIEGGALLFETNDRVIYAGKTYKIMAVKDYTLNNYSEYHLISDYQE